jgi:hypothetical protein
VDRLRRVSTGGIAALLVCAAAAQAAIPRPGVFGGTTSQVYPDGSKGTVEIEMTRNGHRIRSFDITWLAPCDSGFTPLSQGTHAEGWVSSRGRFRGGGSYVSDRGNLAGTQFTARISDRLRGRFVSRTRARGTFQAIAVLRDAGGQQVSTCTTPRVAWRATHR